MVNTHILTTPGSYLTGPPPEKVKVEGVSSGLVVVVYDHREKAGLVGYFIDPRESSEFERMLGTVKSDWNGSGLEVILASSAQWLRSDKNARLYPIVAFEDAGVPTAQIKERSLKRGSVADITFNMRTSKLQIRRSQIRSQDDYPPEPDEGESYDPREPVQLESYDPPEQDDPRWRQMMQKRR